MALAYPVSKFFFSISKSKEDFNSADQIGFSEVTGLDYQIDPIEYRSGNDPSFSKMKMPGLRKFSNVTLKKAVIQGFKDANKDFYHWLASGADGSVSKRLDYRKDVKINLKDEEGNVVVSWTLRQAWPIKVAFTDMKADANEVAVESLELAVEDIKVEYL